MTVVPLTKFIYQSKQTYSLIGVPDPSFFEIWDPLCIFYGRGQPHGSLARLESQKK